jgi:chromosome segregation ATPase
MNANKLRIYDNGPLFNIGDPSEILCFAQAKKRRQAEYEVQNGEVDLQRANQIVETVSGSLETVAKRVNDINRQIEALQKQRAEEKIRAASLKQQLENATNLVKEQKDFVNQLKSEMEALHVRNKPCA